MSNDESSAPNCGSNNYKMGSSFPGERLVIFALGQISDLASTRLAALDTSEEEMKKASLPFRWKSGGLA